MFKRWTQFIHSGKLLTIVSSRDSDWEYKCEIKDWNFVFVHHNIIESILTHNKTINLDWLELNLQISGEQLILKWRWYEYQTTFFGNEDDFIKRNSNIIWEFFNNKIEAEANESIAKLKKQFKKTKGELKGLILPQTKELLLSNFIEVVGEELKEVAELFEDSTVRSSLLNLFNNFWKRWN